MNKLIKLSEVKVATGLSKSSIYSMIQNNEFPKNVLIGKRSVAWIEAEIEQWIDSKISLSREI